MDVAAGVIITTEPVESVDANLVVLVVFLLVDLPVDLPVPVDESEFAVLVFVAVPLVAPTVVESEFEVLDADDARVGRT